MRKAGKNMDKLMKFIPIAVVVGVSACIAIGIALVGMKQENDTKEIATTQQIIQIQDNTVTKSNKEVFELEANKLWELNKEKMICEKNKFIDEYITYRENNLTERQAYNSLYNAYAKEFQIETNDDGEVVASGFNADNVLDENIEEPTVSEEETTAPVQEQSQYTVETLTPVKMYATEVVNLRQGPHASDFSKVGSLKAGDSVTVVGIVKIYKNSTTLWYQLDNGYFVSGAYLVDKLPEKETTTQKQPEQTTQKKPEQTTQKKPEQTTQKQPEQTTSSNGNNGKAEIIYNGDGTVTINGKTFKLGSDIPEEEMTTGDYSNLPTGNVIGN